MDTLIKGGPYFCISSIIILLHLQQTSILMAAMNEIPIIEGNVKVRGTVSYVSQEAWIFSGTVRQNILFGKDYDEKKFENVIDVCALRKVCMLLLYLKLVIFRLSWF